MRGLGFRGIPPRVDLKFQISYFTRSRWFSPKGGISLNKDMIEHMGPFAGTYETNP